MLIIMSWQRRVSRERCLCPKNSVSAGWNFFKLEKQLLLCVLLTTLPLALPSTGTKKRFESVTGLPEEVIVMSTSTEYTITCWAMV